MCLGHRPCRICEEHFRRLREKYPPKFKVRKATKADYRRLTGRLPKGVPNAA